MHPGGRRDPTAAPGTARSSENGAFLSNVIGNGFGHAGAGERVVERPDAGLVSRTSDPHGGAFAVLMKNWPFTNSLFMP